VQVYQVARVSPDGDGEWTVTFSNGATMTLCREDLPRLPVRGDTLLVQLPIAVGFATDELSEEVG
jgi:hypothetical protein